MRKLSYFMLYMLLIVPRSFSNEIRAQFNLIPETIQVSEGDLLEGVLKVWPLENADLIEFKKNLSPNLLNIFYTLEIHSVEVSSNNADVVEVKALYIVKPSKAGASTDFDYKGKLIQLEAPNFQVIPMKDKSKDFYILNQSVNKSYLSMFLVVGLILVAFITILWQWKKRKRNFKKNNKDPIAIDKKMFSEKFELATNRQDYEEIYALKEKWLKHIIDPSPAYQDFFKTMDQHQFKKSWTDGDLNEVKEFFDIIRGSLS